MQGQAENRSVAVKLGPGAQLVSTDPATTKEIWSGKVGDAAAEIAAARAAWPAWAAHSVAYRVEAVRRFANVVRKKVAEFADLLARETG
jgi:succinylglutamic semialdehyde dehydrogenase